MSLAKSAVGHACGPSPLTLKPPRTYHGVPYPNFHDGLDLAAPPDIRRGGELFTLYAHLDDTHAPPSGNVGASVQAGDPSGLIGITGITTGPHLHFVIRFGDEPIDPSGLPPHF